MDDTGARSTPGYRYFKSQQIERRIKAAYHEQHKLLQWAMKGFPESQVETENQRLNKELETLKAQKAELEAQIKASQDAIINVPKLERFVELMLVRIGTLDFEGKRQMLDMLGITVWLDDQTVDITGVIDQEDAVIETTPLSKSLPPLRPTRCSHLHR